jgi:hypothetical protein
MSLSVALCVSGKWNDIDFTDRLRELIPHDDFYTATYTGSAYDADFYMNEPKVKYHPMKDTKPYDDNESRLRRKIPPSHSRDWNKQILIHNHMMRNIPKCDIVIRARFETIVADNIDWSEYIKQSYDDIITLGFNTIFGNTDGRYGYHKTIREGPDDDTKFFINDALIIHPYDSWDCELVDRLYKEKRLIGAEEGWYQILSEPFGIYHKSYHGGAYSATHWEVVKDVDENLHN